ncbi:hypothetical protein ACFL4A_00080 [bacterium]
MRIIKFLLMFCLGVLAASSLVNGANLAQLIAKGKNIEKEFKKNFKDMEVIAESKFYVNESHSQEPQQGKAYVKGSKYRTEQIDVFDNKNITIFDGQTKWMISDNNKKSAMPGTDNYKMQDFFFHNWWNLVDPQKDRIIGLKTIRGKSCYEIKLNEKPNDSIYFPYDSIYVSKKGLQLIRTKFKKDKSKNADSTMEMLDYRKVSGEYRWPYKVVMYIGNKLFLESKVISLKFNKGLEDSLFDVSKYKTETRQDKRKSVYMQQGLSEKEAIEASEVMQKMTDMYRQGEDFGVDEISDPDAMLKYMKMMKNMQEK